MSFTSWTEYWLMVIRLLLYESSSWLPKNGKFVWNEVEIIETGEAGRDGKRAESTQQRKRGRR
jgi:hypothetical protein